MSRRRSTKRRRMVPKYNDQGGSMSDANNTSTTEAPIKSPTTLSGSTLDLYGSSDGWLSLRWDEKDELYLVPRGVYEQAKKRITQDMIPKTWVHLGEYSMVEP